MEIILRSNKQRDAYASLFGIKHLSIDRNLITLEELKEKNYENIFITLDKNMFNSDLFFLEKTLKELDKLNIRGVLFYDLAVLSITKRLDLDLNLIWAGDFLTTNYKTCNYYFKEGVKGVLISNVLTCDEICEISKQVELDTYVNIFGKEMMTISKRHLISNYFEYINEKDQKEKHNMIEKDKSYRITEASYGTKIYSDYVLNGIVYLDRLKQAGVKYIILDDFDIESSIFEKVLNIFNSAIKDCKNLELKEKEIDKLIETKRGFFDKKTIYKVKKK